MLTSLSRGRLAASTALVIIAILVLSAHVAAAQPAPNALPVTRATPPSFIFHTNADTAVPAEMHIFERGPHGVGLANDDQALSEWSKLLTNWLRIRGVIT